MKHLRSKSLFRRVHFGGPVILFFVSAALAQLTREPGVQQSQEVSRAPELPKEWTHPTIEARGVWIPRDSLEARTGESKDQVRERLAKTIDQLKSANFNILLIDCWFK